MSASYRGRGLGRRIISEALDRAQEFAPGRPDIAMLFCHPDRADLYRRHGFAEVPGPVLVEQPDGVVEIPW